MFSFDNMLTGNVLLSIHQIIPRIFENQNFIGKTPCWACQNNLPVSYNKSYWILIVSKYNCLLMKTSCWSGQNNIVSHIIRATGILILCKIWHCLTTGLTIMSFRRYSMSTRARATRSWLLISKPSRALPFRRFWSPSCTRSTWGRSRGCLLGRKYVPLWHVW